MKNLRTRITKLETATSPARRFGRLPALAWFPEGSMPEQRATIEADVERRRAAGETVVLTETREQAMDVLIDLMAP
ncbi:MAG: hypothetical protein ACOY7P_00655 [Pseudomonadota bacterium]